MPANASCATLTTTDPQDGIQFPISKERASKSAKKYPYITVVYEKDAGFGTMARRFAFCPAARFAVYISSKDG
ncbi:hypothetical protein [Bradyrhizobium sp. Leo121]|uniref:hypothetical protein n=1 Tax=Bradyrhizobium sp. Leo121 TaxID=1571195 RepID=UPI0010293E00|nr:hypothetical protein [Bradyrhizobium sp. Leo121]